MRHSKTLLAAASLAALALPGSASAQSHPSSASVAAHVRAANHALHREEALVARHDTRGARAAFALSRRELGAVRSDARRLSRHHLRPDSRALLLRLVAGADNTAAETEAALLDDTAGALQAQLAAAAGADLRDREATLALLSSIVGDLSAPARAAAAAALSALSSDGKDEIASLTQALETGQLPPAVAEVVRGALATASHAIDDGLARLRELVPQLPASQQTAVQTALDRIAEVLPQVVSILNNLLDEHTPATGADVPPATTLQTLLDGLTGSGGFQLPAWLKF